MSDIVGCCGSISFVECWAEILPQKLIITGFSKRKKTMPQKVSYLSVSTHSDRNFR